MVQICALASGSNGNCYYIGDEYDAVLVDAGISRRQVIDRMKEMGLKPEKVRGVFISHEHSDHSRGVRVLAQKLNIPVFMTAITFNNSFPVNQPEKYIPFRPSDVVELGSIKIHTFSKSHDAVEPCSFVIEVQDKYIGVLTDIGEPCSNVQQYVGKCHALFLEANYDEKMLWEGGYPPHLKHRVASKRGHLSNVQALQLVQDHAGEHLQIIYLSHLSEENNTPEIAKSAFQSLQHKHKVLLTNRYAPSGVYSL
jgi:phosphoribosyl 1,2-cyclic phosphodiesterase